MATGQIPRGKPSTVTFLDESVYGTPVASDYQTAIVYKHTLSEVKDNEDDPALGLGLTNTRDQSEPAPALADCKGQIEVPLDFASIGSWLKALIGAPATSGSTNFTHVFTSGGVGIPFRTHEVTTPKASGSMITQFAGVMMDKGTLQVSRKAGFQRLLLDAVFYKETKLGSTAAGTAVAAPARDAIAAAKGIYKIDGTQAANIREINLTYDNQLTPFDDVGDDHISGYGPGVSMLKGTLRARFRQASDLYDLAVAGTRHAGTIDFTRGANNSLVIQIPKVALSRVGVPLEGPGFIEQTFNIMAYQDGSAAMMAATLKNQVAAIV